MKNLKIGKKLIVTFGTIILLFCITVGVSIFSLSTIGGSFTTFYNVPFPVTNQASDLRTNIQEVGKNIGYVIMTNNDQDADQYAGNAETALQSLNNGVAYMKANFTGDMSLVTNFETEMNNIKANREKVMELAMAMKNEEAAELYFGSVMPGLIKATGYLSDINDSALVMAQEEYAASMTWKTTIMYVLIGIALVALLATLVLATYVTRSLTGPIRELEAVANRMAGGDLKVDILYTSRDELGSLADSMRKMAERIGFYISEITVAMRQLADGDLNVTSREQFLGDFGPMQTSIRNLIEKLNDVMTQINQASDQVASGSDQVSSGAQALSQGATEQASSIEELAATINDVSDQIKENAENAKEANKLTIMTGEKVGESNERMQEMIQAMDEITDSSNEIGKIIKTIEDISFQTNILALNAAVEAARAGAAGKGFAVVADEVRNLASKSSEASKNTSALIESSLQSVEKGAKIANDTAESLVSVVDGAKAVIETIEKITKASTEQAMSITQVSQGVDQISSVVQTNSATAEESAAASEELSGQAQMLKGLVGRFKLKGSRPAASLAKVEPARREEPVFESSFTGGMDKY